MVSYPVLLKINANWESSESDLAIQSIFCVNQESKQTLLFEYMHLNPLKKKKIFSLHGNTLSNFFTEYEVTHSHFIIFKDIFVYPSTLYVVSV